MMFRILSKLLIFLLACGLVYAQEHEWITNFEDESLPVLNEKFREIYEDVEDTYSDIDTLQDNEAELTKEVVLHIIVSLPE